MVTDTGCQWTMSSSEPGWLTVHQATGVGSGTVYYTVRPNGSPWERSADLVVSGQPYPITQAPAVATPGCFNGFFPGAITWAPQGGQRNV